MKNQFIKIIGLLAICGAVFTACQKEEDADLSSCYKNGTIPDQIPSGSIVSYTDLFAPPEAKAINLKQATYTTTVFYKNFNTNVVHEYAAAYDATNKQLWLKENLREEQNFAVSSKTRPNDPDGTKYGYFYYYQDLEVEPQVVTIPFDPFEDRQWGFYWDSSCTQLIDVEWRFPKRSDINNLVNHIGTSTKVALDYGLDVKLHGAYIHPNIWTSIGGDGKFWLENYWCFRVSTYMEPWPYPEFFFPQYDKGNNMANVRLVADFN